MYTRWEKKWAVGGAGRQIEEPRKRQRRRWSQSPTQSRHHEERPEHHEGQSGGAGWLRAMGCSLP